MKGLKLTNLNKSILGLVSITIIIQINLLLQTTFYLTVKALLQVGHCIFAMGCYILTYCFRTRHTPVSISKRHREQITTTLLHYSTLTQYNNHQYANIQT